MDNKKVLSYSLLAHIQTSGLLLNDLLDVFVPLVKKSLSSLCQKGLNRDEKITTIKNETSEMFGIDIPIPVLKRILQKISLGLNNESKVNFVLYDDESFILNHFVFEEFDEFELKKKVEITQIEKYFKEFCAVNNVSKNDYSSIFNFIEINKLSLSKYLNENKNPRQQQDFSIEARFLDFFKNIPHVFEEIKSIYLGSIISSYLDYQPGNISHNILLVLDTNFITSLIDLDTIESYDTCNKLIELCKNLGYKIAVLDKTLDETQILINKFSENFNKTFLVKRVYKEGIFSACDRKRLNQADLQRISDNLENILSAKGIEIINVSKTIINKAKFSDDYEKFKRVRNNEKAALHDAIAILFVREKRNEKKIKRFEDVNCWFVNNSANITATGDYRLNTNGGDYHQPEDIKVDDLINIFWLSNPSFSSDITLNNLAEIGLHTLISLSINDRLPKTHIIRELDENIQKYAKEKISEKDVVRIATRISQRNFADLEDLNKLAAKDTEQFVQKLQLEARKQEDVEEDRTQKLEALFNEIQTQNRKLKESRNDFKKKTNDVSQKERELIEENLKIKQEFAIKEKSLENIYRDGQREIFISKAIYSWRRKAWIEFIVFFLILTIAALYYFYTYDWNFSLGCKEYKENLILSIGVSIVTFLISTLTITSLIWKYRNHSNIKAFIDKLKIPENIQPLK